ncbi:hypothetical protein ABIA39_006291 [Nocardia sp. GAS34]|uniref:hypothetical protein n=1 Tax=unclassified Nocardia TaxID=2637762 RepID=UPI003D223E7E
MERFTDNGMTEAQRRRAHTAAEAAQAQIFMKAMLAEECRLQQEIRDLQQNLREILRLLAGIQRRFPHLRPARPDARLPQPHALPPAHGRRSA